MALDSVSDAILSSLWAGLGAVLVEVVLLAFCLFDSGLRNYLSGHIAYVLASIPVLFIVASGLSLGFTLAIQFRRGKWD